MLGREADDRRQAAPPVGQCFARRAKDDIQVEVIEAGPARCRDRIRHGLQVMLPVKEAQDSRVGGLHADAQPVAAQGAQLAQIAAAQIIGIGFQRYLDIGAQRKAVVDDLQDALELRRAQQGWRAAAKIDRAQLGMRVGGRGKAQLLAERRHIARDEMIEVDIGIKGAVAAADGAKGDMQIQGERLIGQGLHW